MEIVTTQPVTETAVQSLPMGREITTAKGSVVGTRYTFNLGSTSDLKAKIKALNPKMSNRELKNEVSRLRHDHVAANRMEAQMFIEMQYQENNFAVIGDHKDSGKSVLRFEKAEVKEAKAPSKTDVLKAHAQKLVDNGLCASIEEAMEVLK
jgi:hypothetical protein